MPRTKQKRQRERGSITLRGNSFWVRVYAGVDPLTKKDIYLTGTCSDPDEAEKLRTKLLHQVDENRRPKTKAKIAKLFEEWTDVRQAEPSTVQRTEQLIRIYILPTFGHLDANELNEKMLEQFYARLQKCRMQCKSLRREKGHKCVPLMPSTVRKIHYIIRPALDLAKRWDYVDVNVAENVDPPDVPDAQPNPPSAREACRILNKAWNIDLVWAIFLWLAMVIGARRGELCSLQWADIDFEAQTMWIAYSEQQLGDGTSRRKDTKTHRKRRVAFDGVTLTLLQALREQAEQRCVAFGSAFKETAYLFSSTLDGSEPWVLDSVTHRYSRMARSLGVRSHQFKSLRQYSATELVSSGVDLRTVAGRLGHGSGGATTLRSYAAWMPTADQRAAEVVTRRLPRFGIVTEQAEPVTVVNGRVMSCACGNNTSWAVLKVTNESVRGICSECGAQVVGIEPIAEVGQESDVGPDLSPYQIVAADLRPLLTDGNLSTGTTLPTVKELAAQYGYSVGTIHRAMALLAKEGLVSASRGVRATVSGPAPPSGYNS
jgi:integrase